MIPNSKDRGRCRFAPAARADVAYLPSGITGFHMQQQVQQHRHSTPPSPPAVSARSTVLDGGPSRVTCASPSPIIATAGAGANGTEPQEFPFGAARAPSSTVTTPKTTSFVSSSRTLGVTTEQRQRHLDEQQQFGDKRET